MEQNGNEHICVCSFWGGSGADMGKAEFSWGGGGELTSKGGSAWAFQNRTAVREGKKRRLGRTTRDSVSYFVVHSAPPFISPPSFLGRRMEGGPLLFICPA